jgi:hypothetical protein
VDECDQKKIRGDAFGRLWPAARAYKLSTQEYHLNKIKEASTEFGPWMETYHSLLWYRSGFNIPHPSRVVCLGRPTESDAKKKRSMNAILGIKPKTSKSKPKAKKKKTKAKNK